MSVRVLIISNLYDFATDEVVHLLETAGVTYLRLNREQLHQHHLTLDPMGPSLVIDGPAGSHLVDQELQSGPVPLGRHGCVEAEPGSYEEETCLIIETVAGP